MQQLDALVREAVALGPARLGGDCGDRRPLR